MFGTTLYRRFCTKARPFRVLGVQQVAIGSLDKPALSTFWGDVMGLKKVHSFKSEKENVDEDVMEVGKGVLGKVEVDLMTPIDPEKSPKVHIPALNHIGLWVDDLPKCVEYLTKNNIKVLGGIRKGASGYEQIIIYLQLYDVTFIHPKTACGVLVELVQAPEEVIKEHDSK